MGTGHLPGHFLPTSRTLGGGGGGGVRGGGWGGISSRQISTTLPLECTHKLHPLVMFSLRLLPGSESVSTEADYNQLCLIYCVNKLFMSSNSMQCKQGK